ncbi:MAG TPA: hypothetical protein VGI83_08850, partial [Gemmatimonadales bacterium]
MSGWKRLALLFLGNVLFASGLAFHAFLYNFYLDGLHHTTIVMGRAAAVWSFAGLLALLPAGRGVDRWGAKPVIMVAASCACAGLAWGAVAGAPLTIYLASAMAGVAAVAWRVAQAPVLMQLSTPANRSRVFALDVALLVASGALSTWASGGLLGLIERSVGVSHGNALTLTLLAGSGITALSVAVYAVAGIPRVERRTPPVGPGATAVSPLVILLAGLSGLWIAGLTMASPFFNLYFARNYHLSVERVSWILSG